MNKPKKEIEESAKAADKAGVPLKLSKDRIVLKADYEALEREHELVMRVARQDSHNLSVLRNLTDTLVDVVEELLSVYSVVGPFSTKRKERRLRGLIVKRAKKALDITRYQRLNPHLVNKEEA